MKNFKKLVLSFFSSLIVFVSSISPCNAFVLEWGTGEAFLWLAGIVGGLVVSTNTWDDFKNVGEIDSFGERFFNAYVKYCVNLGKTAKDAEKWFNDVKKGVVDTASDFFLLFKTYLKSAVIPLANDNGKLSFVSSGDDLAQNMNNIRLSISGRPTYGNMIPNSISVVSYTEGAKIYPFFVKAKTNDGSIKNMVYFFSDKENSKISLNLDYPDYSYGDKTLFINTGTYTGSLSGDTWNTDFGSYNGLNWSDMDGSSSWELVSENIAPSYGGFNFIDMTNIDLSYKYSSDFKFAVASYIGNNVLNNTLELDPPFVNNRKDVNVDNVGLADVATGTLTGDIDINWNNSLPFLKLYDNVVDGTASLDDVSTASKVRPYDTTKNTVIDSSKVTDIPISSVVSDASKNNTAQKLKNPSLASVFPFCIPWDIYSVVKVFSADPVAPSYTFEVPWSIEKDAKPVKYTIDLSNYAPVSTVCRSLFLLLFIVGLAMVTRDLIRG